jgi:hypothetical protein
MQNTETIMEKGNDDPKWDPIKDTNMGMSPNTLHTKYNPTWKEKIQRDYGYTDEFNIIFLSNLSPGQKLRPPEDRSGIRFFETQNLSRIAIKMMQHRLGF